MGAVVGLFIGGLIGLTGVWTLRRIAIRITELGHKLASLLFALVLVALFAWGYFGMVLAAGATSSLMHSLRSNHVDGADSERPGVLRSDMAISLFLRATRPTAHCTSSRAR